MDIKRNRDGTCYESKCDMPAEWLIVDVPLRESSAAAGGSRMVYWNMLVCAAHAESVRLSAGGQLIRPGIVVLEKEF